MGQLEKLKKKNASLLRKLSMLERRLPKNLIAIAHYATEVPCIKAEIMEMIPDRLQSPKGYSQLMGIRKLQLVNREYEILCHLLARLIGAKK